MLVFIFGTLLLLEIDRMLAVNLLVIIIVNDCTNIVKRSQFFSLSHVVIICCSLLLGEEAEASPSIANTLWRV